MMQKGDAEYMRSSHRQIYEHRMKDVTVFLETGKFELDGYGTKVPILEEVNAKAIVTHLSGLTNQDEIGYYGYVFKNGDIKVDIDGEYIEVSTDLPKEIHVGKKKYKAIFAKPKGIIERNRVEYLCREIG